MMDWDFWLCGFGYFLGSVFGFYARKLQFFRFGVHCRLQILCFLAFGLLFLSKILKGFPNLVSDVVSGFSYLGSSFFSMLYLSLLCGFWF